MTLLMVRALRKITMKDYYVTLIWLQSCEQSGYETIPCKVRYDFAILRSFNNICPSRWTLQFDVWRNRVICFRSLAFSCTYFRQLSQLWVSQFFPSPFAKRETLNKNQKHKKKREEIGAGIKIRVCISSNYLSRQHKIYRIKKKHLFQFISA